MIAKIRLIALLLFWTLNFFVFIPWLYLWGWVSKKSFTYYTKIGYPFFVASFKFFGVKVKIHGREQIDPTASYVVMSNHQSMLDIPAIMAFVLPVAFLAKKELFKIPFFGPAIRKTGCLEVDRTNPRNNRDLSARMVANMEQGVSFCVFPEGTRSSDGKLLPFKKGIFRYVKEKPVAILPVTLRGLNKVLSKNKFGLYPGTVDLIIHPPIPKEKVESLGFDELKEHVFSVIGSAL